MNTSPFPLLPLALALSPVLFVIFLYARYRSYKATVNGWPGVLRIFHPMSPVGFLCVKLGLQGTVLSYRPFRGWRRHEQFAETGWNIISVITLLPREVSFFLADADVIKQVTNSHNKFPKPVDRYKGLLQYGKNIVATEGEDWKRHRKVSSPAFSERNNRLVWDTTLGIMNELFDSVWASNEVRVDNFLDCTVQIALMVLSIAGYGNPMTWKSSASAELEGDHKLTWRQAVDYEADLRMIRMLTPEWLLPFFKKGRLALLASKEMKKYLQEMITARRRAPDKHERWDILTNLIRGGEISEKTGEDAKLSPDELIGNVWIYQLAGHETTANAMYVTLVLLAIFPEEQKKLFAHIKDVIGDREPTYDDNSKLTRVLACFYEGLRLYPIVNTVPKRATEDTVLTATRADPDNPETTSVPVKKGTTLQLQLAAVHYNPRYWKDPRKFMPERFMGDWNKDALLAFSAGTRSCIGRKFSETEAVAAITLLISRYKVSLSPELQAQYAQELATDPESVRHKLVFTDGSGFGIRSQPKVPLVFTRRE